jgi:hypothetical protein
VVTPAPQKAPDASPPEPPALPVATPPQSSTTPPLSKPAPPFPADPPPPPADPPPAPGVAARIADGVASIATTVARATRDAIMGEPNPGPAYVPPLPKPRYMGGALEVADDATSARRSNGSWFVRISSEILDALHGAPETSPRSFTGSISDADPATLDRLRRVAPNLHQKLMDRVDGFESTRTRSEASLDDVTTLRTLRIGR